MCHSSALSSDKAGQSPKTEKKFVPYNFQCVQILNAVKLCYNSPTMAPGMSQVQATPAWAGSLVTTTECNDAWAWLGVTHPHTDSTTHHTNHALY